MQPTVVGMYEAKTNFSKLVQRAVAGEEIIVSNAGKPVARIVAYTPERVQRRRGRLKGRIVIHEGFDDLPEGFAEAFGA